jgi:hypothetical protein
LCARPAAALDVPILMPPILAQVDGDAVGPAALRRQRRLDDVRTTSRRLPNGGDVVMLCRGGSWRDV